MQAYTITKFYQFDTVCDLKCWELFAIKRSDIYNSRQLYAYHNRPHSLYIYFIQKSVLHKVVCEFKIYEIKCSQYRIYRHQFVFARFSFNSFET